MKKIALFSLLLPSFGLLYSQIYPAAALDTLVTRTIKAFNVPGIAVAIIKDGKVIHAKGYGVRSLNSQQKVDENTLFGIASNTKAFTTAALGILVDEGRLKWDDKVIKYIPEFRMYNAYVTQEFTIRDLLTHRSGLGLGAGDLMFYPDSSDFTIKDVIHNLRYLKPVSGFRAKYDYDNTLYIVAGEVVTRVSGKAWDKFVEERIFTPLGMDHTAAAYNRLRDKSNVADPHAAIDGLVQVVGRHSSSYSRASGSIYSSVADLSKWVLLQLHHGKYGKGDSATLFSDKVHEEMWSPQTIIALRNAGPYHTNFSAYGLGFGISDVKGFKQLNHTGGTTGMVTQVTMIPDLALGIIVLTNQQEGGAFQAIADQVKDFYLKIDGTDRVAEYAPADNTTTNRIDKQTDSVWMKVETLRHQTGTTFNFSPYTGTYRDNWLGEVTISVNNGKYWFVSKRSPKLTGEIFRYNENRFVVRWLNRAMDADAFIIFQPLKSQKAAGFKMLAISPLTDFSYDFQDLDFKRSNN